MNRLEEDLSVQRRILAVHVRQCRSTAERVRGTASLLGVHPGALGHLTAGITQFEAAERLLSDKATAPKEAQACVNGSSS